MLNRTNHRVRRVAIGAISALALAACSSAGLGNGNGNGGGNGNGAAQVDAEGSTRLDGSLLQAQIDALPTATLTDSATAGLLQMREEEKLAHDVYVALYDTWHVKAFSNISAAEQTHSDAVKVLLDRYSLRDPAGGNAAGVFTDTGLQLLYTKLVEQGSTTLVDALTVGAAIEDLDIADLQSLATTTPDIQLVYDNLEKGSRNHLRAFTKQLAKNGAIYTPTHISSAEYEAIIAGDMERGAAG
jgi:hypothetical protein